MKFPWILTGIIFFQWLLGSVFVIYLIVENGHPHEFLAAFLVFVFPAALLLLVIDPLLRSTDALVGALEAWGSKEQRQKRRRASFWCPPENFFEPLRRGEARGGLCLLEVERPWVEGGSDRKWCLGSVVLGAEGTIFHPMLNYEPAELREATPAIQYITLGQEGVGVIRGSEALMLDRCNRKRSTEVCMALKRWLLALLNAGWWFGLYTIVLLLFFHSIEALLWMVGIYATSGMLINLALNLYSRALVRDIRASGAFWRSGQAARIVWREYDPKNSPQGLCLLKIPPQAQRGSAFLLKYPSFCLGFVTSVNGVPRIQPANWQEFHKEYAINDRIVRVLWVEEPHLVTPLQKIRGEIQDPPRLFQWSPVYGRNRKNVGDNEEQSLK